MFGFVVVVLLFGVVVFGWIVGIVIDGFDKVVVLLFVVEFVIIGVLFVVYFWFGV